MPQEEDWENFYTIKNSEEAVQQNITLNDEFSHIPHYLIRGKYLLTNCKSGILVIHIRRATERIQYEKLLKDFVNAPINAQMLLFPIIKSLPNEDQIIWQENKSLLEQLGFKSEITQNELKLLSVPTIIEEAQIDNCLTELIQLLVHKKIDKGDLAHLVVSIIAKSSSRTATIQVQEQAIALVNELFQLPEHTFTVAGKAILTTITIDEIGLKFN